MAIEIVIFKDKRFDKIPKQDNPDYSNAFICSADYDGCEMTEKELDILNDDRSFVYESLMEHLH